MRKKWFFARFEYELQGNKKTVLRVYVHDDEEVAQDMMMDDMDGFVKTLKLNHCACELQDIGDRTDAALLRDALEKKLMEMSQ